MRIAYIGNFEPEYSTENDVRKAFEYLGHKVIKLQENKLDFGWLNYFEFDMLLITSTWDDAIDLKAWIGMVMNCAKRGIPTATLHLDMFWGTSRDGRLWWRNPMFHTAYIFTADGDYDEQWKLFGKNHIWSPPAVRHDAVGFGKYREQYACDVAFVGSNGVGYHEDVWTYRKELLQALREMCQRNGWSFKNPGGDQPKIDRNNDMNDFYASAKVTVGDSLCLKKEDSFYWSDRVPEATGRGGFLIMPRIKALDVVHPLVSQYNWGDFKGLEKLIKGSLADEAERQRIQKKGLEITKDSHTYVNRAETILETVFK